MHRIDSSSATSNFPIPLPLGTPGFFRHGNPSTGEPYTVVTSDWCNSIQEEVVNVITGAGISLDKTKRDQLLTALNKLYVSRIIVNQNLTIYVSPTGSDVNDGTTPAKAFLTPQAAITAIYSRYDWNGHACTLQLADGTYTFTTSGGTCMFFFGMPMNMYPLNLSVIGNPGFPQNVVIYATQGNCIGAWGAYLRLNGLTLKGTGTVWNMLNNQGMGLAAQASSWVDVYNMHYDSCGMFPIRADNGSVITVNGAGHSITGSGQYADVFAGYGGIIWAPFTTWTVNGWSSTLGLWYTDQGRIEIGSSTFIGTATGPRYTCGDNGVIITNGGGPNYLPGSTAGNTWAGGQYL